MSALLVVIALAAQDPSDAMEVAPPPEAEALTEHDVNPPPLTPLGNEIPSAGAPPSSAPPSSPPSTPPSPLAACGARARASLDDGEVCFRVLAEGADPAVAEDAREALRVLQRLRRHVAAPPHAAPEAPEARPLTLASRWLERGVAEAGVHGALFGGLAGFLSASGVFAALRTSERESLPWLFAAPAVGAVGGALGAGFAADAIAPVADDVAFVASSTWGATYLGTMMQIAVFEESSDVDAASLRFFTVLGAGALGLAVGAGLAPFVDVESGDAAVANDALVWGAVLGGLGLITSVTIGASAAPSASTTAMVLAATGGLPWLGALAAHPWIRLHRLSTWCIDAGGVVGLLVAGAVAAAGTATGGFDARVFPVLLFAGTAAGLGAGAAAAFAVDDALREALPAPPAPLAVAPQVLSVGGGIVPGVRVEVAWW